MEKHSVNGVPGTLTRTPTGSRWVSDPVPAGHGWNGAGALFRAFLRFDDPSGIDSPSFAVTGQVDTVASRRAGDIVAGGMLHDQVRQFFPGLAELIPWHLCYTHGPLHYVANTTYHARNGDLDLAQDSAIWPDATLEQLQDEAQLLARLPDLVERFKAAMRAAGLDGGAL